MIFWFTLVLFMMVLVGAYHRHWSAKFDREQELKSIQRRRAALEARQNKENESE